MQRVLFSLVLIFLSLTSSAQMRQVYADLTSTNNNIKRLSFFSPSQGYIASTGNQNNWIGYTADSGRTIIKREITISNVDYGPYSVNLTFGFSINGVVAFDQNNVLVYGDYGFVPAILKSTNGGISYVLVYHTPIGPNILSSMFNMIFPQNSQTGYAVDGFNIVKTTNGGQDWTRVYTGSSFSIAQLDAIDNNNVFAFSDEESTTAPTGKLIKTTNAGLNWTQVTIPDQRLYAADFITPDKGWINIYLNGDSLLVYYTSTGGLSWVKKNISAINPIRMQRMHFINDSTGYAVTYLYSTYKTSDSGRVWEPLPRDNNFSYLNYGHTEIHFASNSQFWSGGARDFLELTTNGGGIPVPKAYFQIDTTGLFMSNTVKLQNYSKPAYSHKWYRNNVLISTSYHASYQRDPASTHDSIKLVVNNGFQSDSQTIHQYFWPPVIVSSFTPSTGGSGAAITITGQNFTDVASVLFGNIPAASFTVQSPTTISATVSGGASGYVKVITATGRDSLPGFVFLPSPTITSFIPTSATAGTSITITGTSLTGATTVLIGGISAIYIVNSSTQITVTAPSGPSGQISVTTPGGTATIGGYSSLPGISSFTPVRGTNGTIMTINGTSLTGTTSVTVGGVNATSYTVNSSNSITAIVGPGASGSVVVTRPEGNATLPGFTWLPPPVITTINPLSGPVGTTVTISGTGFHNTIPGNTVYFGATRAVITSASPTTLIVTVPFGAGYSPVTVTANNLTGHSSFPFLVTFPGGGSITQSSFTMAAQITSGYEVLPYSTGAADFDGDGKSDLIILKLNNPGNTHGVLIYPNTGTGTSITFGNPIELPGGNESFVTGDIDGDGKTDIVISGAPNLYTYINTSVPGAISFSPVITTGSSLTLQRIRLADMDMDGKNDIIFGSTGSMYVIRNTSEPGDVKYAIPVMIYNSIFERNYVPADLTGDGKPDLVLSGVGVLQNNSTPGVLNFTLAASLPLYNHSYISLGDIDGDGKQDVISGDRYGSQLNVIRNTGSGGAVSFAAPVSYSITSFPAASAVGDLDGDGKPDIAVATAENVITLFKNISVPGSINLVSQKNYFSETFGGENQVALADFNNDGKYEIAVSGESPRTVYVLRNEVKAEPSVQSFSPTIGESGTMVTITGSNFTGTTSVRFGGVSASSYVVNSATSITAVVSTGATGHVSVTNNLGTDSLNGFIYGIPPTISSVIPSSGNVGTLVTITGSNFSTNPSDNIIYFGGVKTRAVTATSTAITAYVPPGSVYAPVSVTKFRRTAWSPKPFLTTFPNGGNPLNTRSFANRINVGNMPYGCLVDFDGDGKLDVAGQLNNTTVAVARNTSIPGQVSFAPATVINGTIGGGGIISEDFDGDGKKDLAFIQSNTHLMVVRNNSTPGNIATSGVYSISTGNFSISGALSAKDIDKDGKAELIYASYSGRVINILKNNSTESAIDFTLNYYYPLDTYGSAVISTDVDDDGRSDILAIAGELSVFRNISTPGNILLSPKSGFHGGDWPTFISAGDLDADGRMDALVSNAEPDGLTVFQNVSTPGNISYNTLPELPSGNMPYSNGINDLDGDGKPEVFAPNRSEDSLTVFPNNSSTGTISFAPYFKIGSGNTTNRLESGDLDGDGKPDIILFGTGMPATIIRNQHGGAGPQINSFSPVSGTAGTLITITGERFTGISNVTFGGVSAASYNVISPNVIEAVLGTGATGPVSVHSSAGITSLTGFTFDNKPVVSSFFPTSAFTSATITINGANLNGTTAVYFGNTPAASFVVNPNGSISAVIGAGNTGLVKVVSSAGSDSLGTFIHLRPPTITSFNPLLGNLGSTVVITGTNFTDVTAVRFGGVSAHSYTVQSETTITAIVSNGHTGQIEVVTPGGVAIANGFIYNNSAIISDFFPKSAGAGNSVILYGNNLGSVSAVKFGGVSASSFSIESPTRIRAIVGAGASGDISITNQLYTTSISGFNYLNTGVPYITSITPMAGTTGSVITITGQQFTGTGITEVRFGNFQASSFSVVSDSLILATVGAGGSGLVTILSPGGTNSIDGFIYTAAPVITSFTPVSAAPLSTVTITGQNFSNSLSGNIVFFGTVKATATAASNNYLTVTVPYGATMAPITVTTNELTAYSVAEFVPTFNGSSEISPTAFIRSTDSASSKTPSALTLGDLNLDNKPDIVVCNPSGSTLNSNLTFYINVSNTPNIWLAPRTTFHTALGPYSSTYADFNNDGKPDIASTAGPSTTVFTLLPNNSSGGNLTFSSPLTFPGPYESGKCLSADFDKDGKTDFCILGDINGAVYTYRNTGSVSSFNFAAAQIFSTFLYATDMAITDIDGNGKPDIIVVGGNSTLPSMYILKNTSTSGSISFQTLVLNLPINVNQVITGDLDNDNKPEVILANYSLDELLILKNRSVPGYFSLEAVLHLPVQNPGSFSLSDISGDGKPDLIVADIYNNYVYVLANKSGSTAINFEHPVSFFVSNLGGNVTACDMDGDGRPELIRTNPYSYSISVMQNKQPVYDFTNISLCANGNTSITTSLSGTAYQWQQDNGSGYVNINNNSYFSGTNTSTLRLTGIPVTWNNYRYRCVINGTQYSPLYRLVISPVETPVLTISGNTTVSSGQTITLTTTLVNGGISPQYLWQDSTGSLGWQNISATNSSTITYTPARSGNKIRCLLTNTSGCAIPAMVNSNTLVFTVNTVTAVNPVQGSRVGIRSYPNPVESTLYLDSLKISDKWVSLQILSVNGGKTDLPIIIMNRTSLTINVEKLSSGYYIAVLRRKTGPAAYIRFIKQ